MKKFLGKEAAQYLLLFLVLVIVYSPVLFSGKTVGPDADIILGSLKKITGLGDYAHALFGLELIDFQPIRDLTLFLDLYAFNNWGINTFIFQNLLYWFIGCVFAEKILRQYHPHRYFLIFLFAVYPLFAGTICWNMARKHVLAFMFIMMATDAFLRSRTYRATLFYFLSVFSQPITILWPLWTLTQKRTFRSIPMFIILGTAFIINLNYYQKSQTFLNIYDPKTNSLILGDMFLALGHYAFQLFLPYRSALYYSLGDWFIWIGILILLVLGLMVRRLDRTGKSWVLFSVLPLITIIVKPQSLYDTYLLVPAFGVFMILSGLRINKKILVAVFCFWSVFTFYETLAWTDKNKFAEKNFNRRANCISATRLVRQSLVDNGKAPPEAINFLKNNECFDETTNYKALDSLILKSHLIFYDQDLAHEKKYQALTYYGQFNFNTMLIQIGYLIKEDRLEEANKVLDTFLNKVVTPLEGSEDRIFKEIVWPYCQKQGNQRCLAIIKPLVQPPNAPYW